MKKLGLIVGLVMIMGAMITSAQAADLKKIGFVDLSRCFDEYYKTKEYDKVLQGKQAEYEKITKEKVDAIRDVEGKMAVLKDDQKAAKEKEVEKMKADLLEYDRQQKTNLTKERNEKIREILLEIEKIVSSYAEKEGYSLVLNDRVLVYGNQAFEITEQILGILNVKDAKK